MPVNYFQTITGYEIIENNNSNNIDPVGECLNYYRDLIPYRAGVGKPIQEGLYNLECIYKAESFNQFNNLKLFTSFIDINNIQKTSNIMSYNLVAEQYCSQLSTNCLNNESHCSSFFSSEPDLGGYCRASQEGKSYNGIYVPEISSMDNAKINICSKYDLPECACIRKVIDNDYIAINNYESVNTDPLMNGNCWYLPCLTGSNILTLSSDSGLSTICHDPTVTCAILNEVVLDLQKKSNKLSNQVYDKIFCLTGPSFQIKDTINDTSSFSVSSSSSSSSSSLNQLSIALMVIVGILLIGIIVFFSLSVSSKKNHHHSITETKINYF